MRGLAVLALTQKEGARAMWHERLLSYFVCEFLTGGAIPSERCADFGYICRSSRLSRCSSSRSRTDESEFNRLWPMRVNSAGLQICFARRSGNRPAVPNPPSRHRSVGSTRAIAIVYRPTKRSTRVICTLKTGIPAGSNRTTNAIIVGRSGTRRVQLAVGRFSP